MKYIKERDLIELGFEKCYDSEDGDKFYYFSLNIGNNFSMITNTDDECHDDCWLVEIFDYSDIRFNSLKKLKRLVKLLKSGLNA